MSSSHCESSRGHSGQVFSPFEHTCQLKVCRPNLAHLKLWLRINWGSIKSKNLYFFSFCLKRMQLIVLTTLKPRQISWNFSVIFDFGVKRATENMKWGQSDSCWWAWKKFDDWLECLLEQQRVDFTSLFLYSLWIFVFLHHCEIMNKTTVEIRHKKWMLMMCLSLILSYICFKHHIQYNWENVIIIIICYTMFKTKIFL